MRLDYGTLAAHRITAKYNTRTITHILKVIRGGGEGTRERNREAGASVELFDRGNERTIINHRRIDQSNQSVFEEERTIENNTTPN